jgi:hypothetical protein
MGRGDTTSNILCITKRCTGVAAGGFSVFRASTGRNPVNAVVMLGRIASQVEQRGDGAMLFDTAMLQM